MRMSYDAESAIKVLQQGLNPNRKHSFVQADMLVCFYCGIRVCIHDDSPLVPELRRHLWVFNVYF